MSSCRALTRGPTVKRQRPVRRRPLFVPWFLVRFGFHLYLSLARIPAPWLEGTTREFARALAAPGIKKKRTLGTTSRACAPASTRRTSPWRAFSRAHFGPPYVHVHVHVSFSRTTSGDRHRTAPSSPCHVHVPPRSRPGRVLRREARISAPPALSSQCHPAVSLLATRVATFRSDLEADSHGREGSRTVGAPDSWHVSESATRQTTSLLFLSSLDVRLASRGSGALFYVAAAPKLLIFHSISSPLVPPLLPITEVSCTYDFNTLRKHHVAHS